MKPRFLLLCLLALSTVFNVSASAIRSVPLSPALSFDWKGDAALSYVALPHLRAHVFSGEWNGKPFRVFIYNYVPREMATRTTVQKYWKEYVAGTHEAVLSGNNPCKLEESEFSCSVTTRATGAETAHFSKLYWKGKRYLALMRIEADPIAIEQINFQFNLVRK